MDSWLLLANCKIDFYILFKDLVLFLIINYGLRSPYLINNQTFSQLLLRVGNKIGSFLQLCKARYHTILAKFVELATSGCHLPSCRASPEPTDKLLKPLCWILALCINSVWCKPYNGVWELWLLLYTSSFKQLCASSGLVKATVTILEFW